jgi:hypothetical protein
MLELLEYLDIIIMQEVGTTYQHIRHLKMVSLLKILDGDMMEHIIKYGLVRLLIRGHTHKFS